MLMAEALQDAGYAVSQAEDGPSALKILHSIGRIDLLVTDVGLQGGMNGRQVAEAARVLHPSLKVPFVTRYAENAALNAGNLHAGMQVIVKPFGMTTRGNKVREMIERITLKSAGNC
jgi:CheY-like chemotaxis protein